MRGVFADVRIIFPTTIALSAGGFADEDATIQQRGIICGDRIRRNFSRFLRQACLGNDQQILQTRAVLLNQLAQKRALITVTWLETNVGVERMAADRGRGRALGRADGADAIAASSAFLTTSDVRGVAGRGSTARPEHRDVCGRCRSPSSMTTTTHPPPGARDRRVVVSFGVLNRLKQGRVLADACRPLRCLARVRRARGRADAAEVRAATAAVVVGEVDAAEYRRWLAEATVAVQLRSATNGESSAAIGDCLAAGVPTVVTEIGANRFIPDERW